MCGAGAAGRRRNPASAAEIIQSLGARAMTENSCRLMRTFGEGGAKTTLSFESDAPGEMDMLVVGKNLESYREQVPARFLPVPSKPFDGGPAVSVETKLPAVLWPHVHLLPEAIQARLEQKAMAAGSRPGVRPPAVDPAERAVIRTELQDFASKTTELEIQSRRSRPCHPRDGLARRTYKAVQQVPSRLASGLASSIQTSKIGSPDGYGRQIRRNGSATAITRPP